jgi:hypothetical protein
MDYCIRPLRDTARTCPSGAIVLGETIGLDRNTFDFGDRIFGRPNPIMEVNTEAWMVSGIIL